MLCITIVKHLEFSKIKHYIKFTLFLFSYVCTHFCTHAHSHTLVVKPMHTKLCTHHHLESKHAQVCQCKKRLQNIYCTLNTIHTSCTKVPLTGVNAFVLFQTNTFKQFVQYIENVCMRKLICTT